MMSDNCDIKNSNSEGCKADTNSEVVHSINEKVLKKFDAYSFKHAAIILKNTFPEYLKEIEDALLNFKITTYEIGLPGGNESVIVKNFSKKLYASGWNATKIQGDLTIRKMETRGESVNKKKPKYESEEEIVKENHIDGHQIDHVKGSIALEIEWNSKDQTFDRDLVAFSKFHEYGVIDVGILITRSEELEKCFDGIYRREKNGEFCVDEQGNKQVVGAKYGKSTTHIGKLLYRLKTGRGGGCPVLVFAIKPDAIEDLHETPK